MLSASKIYKPNEIDYVLTQALNDVKIVNNNKKQSYYNMPVSFDIETSSFSTQCGKKHACMYVWMMSINGYIIVGRFWTEWLDVIKSIEKYASTVKIIIWVHNLSYEFQFIKYMFKWSKVFAIKDKTPIYAITDTGLEFRCSYMLSGLKLEKTAEELIASDLSKKCGDLDYSKIRHGFTPLTETELGYCIADVQIVDEYIRQKIKQDGDITRIPLTKTGYVRNFVREKTLYNGGVHRGYTEYKKLIKSLTLTTHEYKMLKLAFQGGFTHAQAWYVDRLIEAVHSQDFTSAYPYVMLTEQFPMGKGRLVKITSESQLEQYLNFYCCLFNVKLYNVKPRLPYDNPLSYSKCSNVKNAVINNGRIVSADELITTITEQDWFTLCDFYTFDLPKTKFGDFYIYEKGYLPKSFILAIIEMYAKKTVLKGVKGKEEEYQLNKGMLNACYGMTVTDPCRQEIEFTNDWVERKDRKPVDIDTLVNKYNSSKNRFLYYPWGVWITAYARRNLFSAIKALGDDYIYADTDSVKYINHSTHVEYFENYNKEVEIKLNRMCQHYGIEFDSLQPTDIKGKKHLIGVWDYEGQYTYFKTNGAKRYMTYRWDDNEYKLSLTVSGLNKDKAIPYILEKCNYDIIKCFEFFEDGMEIPAEHTGCLTHLYIDKGCEGELEDYLGNIAPYQELSYVHLEGSEYNMNMESIFEYLNFLKEMEEI